MSDTKPPVVNPLWMAPFLFPTYVILLMALGRPDHDRIHPDEVSRVLGYGGAFWTLAVMGTMLTIAAHFGGAS